jgi:N-acetylglucosamine malate deacetylase 2
MLVAAHPDDETAGAGGILPRLRDLVIVHVTDGAPRNMADARRAGYDDRGDYARARRQELLNALELAGIGQERTRNIGIADQEASPEMTAIASRLAKLLREVRPSAILTHPYEGGHPDHDATAFAVHAACLLSPQPPHVYEFTSYHAADGAENSAAFEFGRFLPGEDRGEAVTLTEADRERKIRMLDCFATQADILRRFPVDIERFRPAPLYDFTQPPHPGRLLYENFDWGMTGEHWRTLAAQARQSLGIPELTP